MKTDTNDSNVILKEIRKDQLKLLSRKELEELFLGEQKLRIQAFESLEKKYEVEGKYIILKKRFFAPKSEKSKNKKNNKKKKDKKKPVNRILLPSERYPNLDVVESDVKLEELPNCDCCNSLMEETGLNDVTEKLSVEPRKYFIERFFHIKYKCHKCDTLQTTPRVPSIKPGSSYSDELIIDASLSKYCDLMPMGRYAAMASRENLINIPPNSLIELTHYLSFYLKDVILKIKEEVLNSEVLFADETTHRMFEQVNKQHWYLWGFSSFTATYFECHPSRSGDVAANLLKDSQCMSLMSDVFSGYGRAVKIVNSYRRENNLVQIMETFCNAHARRKFTEIEENSIAKFFIWCYSKIYKNEKFKNRPIQKWFFKVMKLKAEKEIKTISRKSFLYKGLNYFLSNYRGLTYFLNFDYIPIDNNYSERQLRSPVIGRKTWFGTHSLLGGQTAANLFTIIQTCKHNNVNPRKYIKWIIDRIRDKKEVCTPFKAKEDFPQIFSPD